MGSSLPGNHGRRIRPTGRDYGGLFLPMTSAGRRPGACMLMPPSAGSPRRRGGVPRTRMPKRAANRRPAAEMARADRPRGGAASAGGGGTRLMALEDEIVTTAPWKSMSKPKRSRRIPRSWRATEADIMFGGMPGCKVAALLPCFRRLFPPNS